MRTRRGKTCGSGKAGAAHAQQGVRSVGESLVLRDESISKLHAWFEVDDDRNYWLSDANSTNFTFANGAKLKPQTPTPIVDGSEIRFGSVSCVFAGAAMAYDVVTRARRTVSNGRARDP